MEEIFGYFQVVHEKKVDKVKPIHMDGEGLFVKLSVEEDEHCHNCVWSRTKSVLEEKTFYLR